MTTNLDTGSNPIPGKRSSRNVRVNCNASADISSMSTTRRAERKKKKKKPYHMLERPLSTRIRTLKSIAYITYTGQA